MKTYRDLIVWQKAYAFTIALYKSTQSFPKEEVYGLTSQIRRATVSITSNIAEGFGRSGAKEKDQFYAIAHGSLYEVESQLFVALGVGYISPENHAQLLFDIEEVSKLLQGLRKANKERSRFSSNL